MHDFLRSRRSVRRLSDRAIDRETVERILSTAASAPSAHNRQPWRFVVLATDDDKRALADAMGARLREDRQSDGDDADAIEADVARSKGRIASAAVVIVVFMSMEDMDAYPDARRRDAERTMAVQGTAMAMQNLLLAAHAEGLGACLMCAPLFCPDVVAAALGTPSHWNPQALITLGAIDAVGQIRPRKPLAEIVRTRTPRS